jgi:CRP-like cAMP-binding protein
LTAIYLLYMSRVCLPRAIEGGNGPPGKILRLIGRDDYIGEFALLTAEPRSASAVAKSFCLLQVLLKRLP